MFEGELLAITVAPDAKAPTDNVREAELLTGVGIAGDRYAGPKRSANESKRQVTLIEAEAIQSAATDYQVELTHEETRRNLLTRGVPLNHLVGREFFVGSVRLRGVELCEPCKPLERMTQAGFVDAFRHRGGLRAEIVTGGLIHVGDVIRAA